MTGAWIVHLSAAAEADFQDILRWTEKQFGRNQALAYAEVLSDTLAALVMGPQTIGAKERPEIGKDIYTVHVARHGRRGRHFILLRAQREEDRRTVDIFRILHDAMELARHLPPGRHDQ